MFPRSSSWMDSARVPSSPLASGPDEVSQRTRSSNDTNRHHAPVQIADDATARVTRRTGKRAFPRESGPPSPKTARPRLRDDVTFFFSDSRTHASRRRRLYQYDIQVYTHHHRVTTSRASRYTRARARARPDLSQRLRPTARRITPHRRVQRRRTPAAWTRRRRLGTRWWRRRPPSRPGVRIPHPPAPHAPSPPYPRRSRRRRRVRRC